MHCVALLGCHPGASDLSMKLGSLELPGDLLTRCKRIIKDMVTDICATVPFMLGDINSAGKLALEKKRMPLAGFLLLWPLHVARASTNEDTEKEDWIKRRFECIDNEMGIRFGRLMANKIMKESWNLR